MQLVVNLNIKEKLLINHNIIVYTEKQHYSLADLDWDSIHVQWV